MTSRESGDVLEPTRPSRQAPLEPVAIYLGFDGQDELPDDILQGPIELTIEPTDAHGEFAEWLTDEWWTGVIARWADCVCTVHVAPTAGALIHPVVLHQIEMLRRVTPDWRLVGHAYGDDVFTNEDIDRLVRSGYHELRFIDGSRHDTPSTDRTATPHRLEELFSRIRQEQSRQGKTAPVLIRVPSTHPRSASTTTPHTETTTEVPVR